MDKLRTYKLIKHTFEIEHYLEISPDRKQQKSLAAFKINAHKLQIERGRYISIKLEDRLCTSCNNVEDEIHLLCDCFKYMLFRTNMYRNIGNGVPSRERIINIMTSTDEKVVKSLGQFVPSCNIS